MKPNSKNIINSGFTLIEVLINMLIVSTVTVSMFYMFNLLNDVSRDDMNESNIRNYANLVLNAMSYEITKTKDIIGYDGSQGRLKEIETSECFMIFDFDRGLTIDYKEDRENSHITDKKYHFSKNDDLGRKVYRVTDFNVIKNPPPIVGLEGQFGEDVNIRKASRGLYLEFSLYSIYDDDDADALDVIKFERRVFSPGNYLYNKDDSNEI